MAAPQLTPTQIDELLVEALGFHADARLLAAVLPHLLSVAIAGSDYIAALLGRSGLVGPGNRAVAAFLDAREPFLLGMNATTRYRVRRALLAAVDDEATSAELQSAVMDVFDGAITGRAALAANQEGGGAWSVGVYDDMKQGGIPSSSWLTMGDEKVRDTHDAMEDQCRLVGTSFTTGAGFPLLYPRDPDGEASEVFGCRCQLIPNIGNCGTAAAHRFTQDQRRQHWKAQDRAMAAAIRPVKYAVQGQFRTQREAVLAALERRVA